MILRNRRLFAILSSILVLLLIPLVAMLFMNEVNWTIKDFILAGILLLSTGLVIEFVLRKVKTKQNRIALLTTILILLIFIWVELAVGIFETPFAGS